MVAPPSGRPLHSIRRGSPLGCQSEKGTFPLCAAKLAKHARRASQRRVQSRFAPGVAVMESTAHRAVAIVGLGAILPDAPNVSTLWDNIKTGRYSVTDVESDRWDPKLYYDPDPKAPDKTYSKIGGWVREYAWEPMKWH